MSTPVVKLANDTLLRGKTVYARDSKKPISAFVGVPFAEPPVGNLRFKRPQPLKLWKGVKEAVQFGNVCPQNMKATARSYGIYPMPTNESEDCLYLNVYSPSVNTERKLPVMMWIHGGAFTQGFSDFFEGTAICTLHDVVFVSINYRLGALGFLPFLGDEVDANCGLLDQVEAMKWIQKYIINFGGNPDNVTIFGESAGGISVSLHCLSPLTKGLFHKAICQSGSALYPSIVWKNEGFKKYLTKRLKSMGCKEFTDDGLIRFLKNCSAENLVGGIQNGNIVVDHYYLKEDPMDLYKAMKFHDVEMLLGFCSDEGISFVLNMTKNKGISSRSQARQLVEMMVTKMFFRGMQGTDAVIEGIMNEYFGPEVSGEDRLNKAVFDLNGDATYVMPAVLNAKLHSVKQPTFLYVYNHRLSISPYPDYITGAAHGQEVTAVIGEPFLDRFPNIWPETEVQLSRNIMQYWANFAVSGDPKGPGLVSWPEFQDLPGKDCYLAINTNPSSHCNFNPRREHFWNKVVPGILKKNETKAKY